MVVVVLERVPDRLRGSLRRWLLEVQAGVFVGNLSQRVRQEIWTRVCAESGAGAAVMLASGRNEQGHSVQVRGEPDRSLVDFDGLVLVARPRRERKPARSRSAKQPPRSPAATGRPEAASNSAPPEASDEPEGPSGRS